MFEFAWPWAFLLIPLPFIVRWLLPPIKNTRPALWLPQARYLRPTDSSALQTQLSGWLLPLLIWLAVIAAIAQPRWLSEPIPINPEAREIMIALDLSGSMEMDDMTYNGRRTSRLEAAHKILADFIRRRQGDRIGLIVYADSAHVYAPISSDLNTIAKLAEEAQIGLAGERTALGDAIALSIRYFSERENTERVVLMITDGMINSGEISAEQAIYLAKNHDVKIHTIGIGAEEMTVRGLFGERRINPSSDLDESFLATLAGTTGGEYFRAKSESDMESIYTAIDALEPISADEQFFRPHTSLVQWPLGIALLLSILYFIRSTFGKTIWLRLQRGSE